MRKLLLLLISLVLIFVFEGCKKSSTGPGEEDNDEIKLSENTIILADSTVNKINQALGDSVVYFKKDAQEVLQLKEGDVIVSAVEEGFLRKVKGIKEETGNIIVRTDYATLEDAIDKGELSISDMKLDFQDMRIDYKQRGVRLKSRGDLLEVDFNALLYQDPETGAEVKSFGKTLLGASIDTLGASFLFGLQSLKFGLEVYHSETLGVEISAVCDFEGRKKIASFTLSPFIVYVGIPIVITPHIDLYIGADLSVQAAVNSSISKNDTIVGGIVYNKGEGWSTYSDYKKYFSYALPSVSSSAEAKVYAIAPEISLQVYEFIGPYAQMEGYSRIEVDPQVVPWWILYGGFEVEGGVKMEILAWDVTWSGSIYSNEWELASAGGGTNTPPSTPATPSGPDTGNVGTSYSFSTSTTDPDGDNVAYQFDWGDGNLSSWSSYVSSGSSVSMSHSWSSTGTYSVKAKAKDANGAESGWSDGLFFTITLETGTVTDIDGNVYQTVKIGNQWWMSENLKVTHYRNGDAIPNVTDATEWSNLITGAYCNYGNDVNNATTYGRLYNWYAVNDSRNIAPEGWHVSSDAEWKTLEMYLGMSQSEADDIGWRGTDEGGKLKETGTIHWNSPNTGATNENGFSALPGGFRLNGTCDGMGFFAYFWSSSEYLSDGAWNRNLHYGSSVISRRSGSKQYGFSVRCVRD